MNKQTVKPIISSGEAIKITGLSRNTFYTYVRQNAFPMQRSSALRDASYVFAVLCWKLGQTVPSTDRPK